MALRRHTPARIAIGRVGSGLPTHAYLEFQAAHARARDAVHAALDVDAMMQSIAACGWPAIPVRSAAADRQAYLRMPDLGRRLSAESRARLSEPMVAPDVVIVIGDGLSSVAVERNAVPVLQCLGPRLAAAGLQLAPIILAVQARVALADEIGELLQAKLALIMIGERPGLSAADSLGIYLTFAPRVRPRGQRAQLHLQHPRRRHERRRCRRASGGADTLHARASGLGRAARVQNARAGAER